MPLDWIRSKNSQKNENSLSLNKIYSKFQRDSEIKICKILDDPWQKW